MLQMCGPKGPPLQQYPRESSRVCLSKLELSPSVWLTPSSDDPSYTQREVIVTQASITLQTRLQC